MISLFRYPAVLVPFLIANLVPAENWPQRRGPYFNGSTIRTTRKLYCVGKGR